MPDYRPGPYRRCPCGGWPAFMIFMKRAGGRSPARCSDYRWRMNAAVLARLQDAPDPPEGLWSFALAANRPVQIALLLSALIHTIALGWLPGLDRLATVAPLPLRILLPPVPPPSPKAAPAAVPPPLPRQAAPAAPAAPAPLLSQVAAAPAKADEAPAARMAPSPERSTAPVVGDMPPPATPAGPPAIDAQALAGYGRSVAGAVAVQQRYPRIAQMRQWQGMTMLQLEFAADGRLLETRVLSSSGHEVLDRQALDMVRAAQPLPSVPPALAGRALTVNVPVVFRLAG